MYAMRTGKDLNKHWEFYIIFNIFKIAAILQGILGRVRDGTATSKHAEERGCKSTLSQRQPGIMCLKSTVNQSVVTFSKFESS